jgi:membrane associated rhomboid family serine protease
MTPTPRKQGLFILSLLFAAAPFGAGLIRAVQTGNDLRLLWMAAGACVGGVVAILITRSRGRTSLFSQAATAFILSGALTTAMGFMLGARTGPGVAMIAIVFGLCWGASAVLVSRSRAVS